VAGRKGDPLADALPDERWVVRCWLPDGSATDVIGWIEALDATSVRLSSVDQHVHVIERSKIIAARHDHVGHQVLRYALVSGDPGHLTDVLDRCERLVAGRPEVELLSVRRRLHGEDD